MAAGARPDGGYPLRSPLLTADQFADQALITKEATVTLTNGQIKALPTVPVVIVPATEVLNYSGFPTKLFFPTKAYAILNSVAGAYTNVDSPCPVFIAWGSDWSSQIGFHGDLTTDILHVAVNEMLFRLQPFSDEASIRAMDFLITAGVLNTDEFYDNAISIALDNQGSGNLTGGHANNTLKVVVQYFEVDIG